MRPSDASESVEDGLEADVDDAIATAFGCNRPHLPISSGKSTCIIAHVTPVVRT